MLVLRKHLLVVEMSVVLLIEHLLLIGDHVVEVNLIHALLIVSFLLSIDAGRTVMTQLLIPKFMLEIFKRYIKIRV